MEYAALPFCFLSSIMVCLAILQETGFAKYPNKIIFNEDCILGLWSFMYIRHDAIFNPFRMQPQYVSVRGVSEQLSFRRSLWDEDAREVPDNILDSAFIQLDFKMPRIETAWVKMKWVIIRLLRKMASERIHRV